MPASLSATTASLAAKGFGDLRTLVQVDFTSPAAATFRFSDQHLKNCGGQEWLPMVARWGNMVARVDLQSGPSVTPERFSVTFDNTRPIRGRQRLSDYIWSPQNTRGAYVWTNAKVTIYQALSDTAAAGDLVTLGVFYMEEPTKVGRREFTVAMSDVTLAIESKIQLLKVTSDVFANAPASALDKYVPVPFGDLSGANKRVALIPVVAGKRTTLTAELASGATTATVASTDGFPSSGYLLCDGELINYTGKTSTTFTGLTRGVSTSDDETHAVGLSVLEARTGSQAFRLLVGMNVLGGIAAVSSLEARGASVVSPITTTTTLAETALVSGYSFAVVDVDAGSSESDYFDFYCLPAGNKPVLTTTTLPASDTDTGSTNAVSVAFPAKSRLSVQPESVTVKVKMTWTDGAPAVSSARFRLDTSNVELQNPMTNGQEYEVTVPVTAYSTSLTWRFIWNGTATAMNCQVLACQYNWPDVGQGSAESAADATIGEVTALVQGIKDDGSGTISGTPDLLLKNPTDVAKAIMLGLYDTTPGVVSGDLGTSWAASRSKHATRGFEWAGVLEAVAFSTLRQDLMRQARCLLYAAGGKLEWKFLDDGPSVDHSIEYENEVASSKPAEVTYLSREQLYNRVVVESQYGPADGVYNDTTPWQDLTQPGFSTAVPQALSLPWVHATAMRDDLGRFWRDQWKRPRAGAEFEAWYNLISLQLADVIEFTGHPLLATHGASGLTFRVVTRSLSPARGRVTVDLREAANHFWDREYFAQAFTDEPRSVPGLVPTHYANSQRILARRDPSENNKVYGKRNRLLSSMGG